MKHSLIGSNNQFIHSHSSFIKIQTCHTPHIHIVNREIELDYPRLRLGELEL